MYPPPAALIALAVVISLPLAYYLYDRVQRRRLRRRLQAQWGQASALRRPDQDMVADIAAYHEARKAVQPKNGLVDDTTWRDLDMDEVLRGLDCSMSIVGSELLYDILRRQGAPEALIRRRQRLARALRDDEELRLRVQEILQGIGYGAFHGASRFLFEPDYQYPRWRWLYRVLAAAPTLCLLLGLLHPYFLFAALGCFGVNAFVYYRSQETWKREFFAIKHIAVTLSAAQRLSRLKEAALSEEQARLQPLIRQLRSIRRWLPLFGMEQMGDMAVLLDYLKIMFTLDMVSLVQIISALSRHGEAVRELYALVGELDACQSLAQLMQREPGLCEPAFEQALCVRAQDLRHPLIRDAVGNDLVWQRHLLITGSNASGKSTFIKAAALSAILAQTIGLCFAERFTMCRARVMSSMAIRDNVLAGESYFIAEIRSLKRILDAADGQPPVLCFIDEILRGTNTIERIAASSAVLGALSAKRMLCMAATHDIELTALLKEGWENAHFAETVDEAGVRFDYRLKEGPTRTRNAILLLQQMGYDQDIVKIAAESVAAFEATGRWRQPD